MQSFYQWLAEVRHQPVVQSDNLRVILQSLPPRMQVQFALYCATDALQYNNDQTRGAAQRCIDVVRQWLRNPKEVSSEELRTAANAAAHAANAAARDTAYAAAFAANAARSAANAARDAAYAAAYNAADAAYDAAYAAYYAASDAAYAAEYATHSTTYQQKMAQYKDKLHFIAAQSRTDAVIPKPFSKRQLSPKKNKNQLIDTVMSILDDAQEQDNDIVKPVTVNNNIVAYKLYTPEGTREVVSGVSLPDLAAKIVDNPDLLAWFTDLFKKKQPK